MYCLRKVLVLFYHDRNRIQYLTGKLNIDYTINAYRAIMTIKNQKYVRNKLNIKLKI